MWPYLAVFAAALASDSIPVFGPPAWTLMVFFWKTFDLNPWLTLLAGVPGSVLGRYLLSLYMPRLSHRFVKRRKNEELEFVGRKMNRSLGRSWLFVLIYSLTPLSTTALFSAAGVAKVRSIQIVPPFFVGKFISDVVMMFGSGYAIGSFSELLRGTFSWKGLAAAAAGIAMLLLVFCTDWRLLLERRKLRFEFRIWR